MAQQYVAIGATVGKQETVLSQLSDLWGEAQQLAANLEALGDRGFGPVPRDANKTAGDSSAVLAHTLDDVVSGIRRALASAHEGCGRLERIA